MLVDVDNALQNAWGFLASSFSNGKGDFVFLYAFYPLGSAKTKALIWGPTEFFAAVRPHCARSSRKTRRCLNTKEVYQRIQQANRNSDQTQLRASAHPCTLIFRTKRVYSSRRRAARGASWWKDRQRWTGCGILETHSPYFFFHAKIPASKHVRPAAQ